MTLFFGMFEYILCLLEFLFAYVFISEALGRKEKELPYFMYIAVASGVVFILSVNSLYSTFKNILYTGLMVGFSFLFLDSRWKKLLCAVLFLTGQILIEIFVMHALSFLFEVPNEMIGLQFSAYRIVYSFIIKILLFVYLKACVAVFFRKKLMLPSKNWYIMYVLFAVTLACVLILFHLNLQDAFNEYTVYFIAVYFGIVMFNAITYLMFVFMNQFYVEREKIKTFKMAATAEENLTQLQKQHDKAVKDMWHDINRYMRCIHDLTEKKEYDDLKKYVQSIDQSIKSIPYVIYTGNNLADAVVNQVKAEAEEKNIDFIVYAGCKPDIKMAPSEFISLLSNLLDNAIEACEKIETGQDKRIELHIRSGDDDVMVIVRNSVNHKNIELRKTSKADKQLHGRGYGIIREIVQRYDGSIEYDWYGELFQVFVLLNI